MTRNHADRFILQSTAEVMNSAVRHIDSIVNWMAGDGSLSYGGMTVPGSVNELRRCKSELAEALQKSAFFLADEWNYIENNRARLAVKLSHQFCTGLSDEDFENLIAHRQLPMMQGMWFGEKHYATYFGKRCGPTVASRLDSAGITDKG